MDQIVTPVERLRCGVSEGGLAASWSLELARTCHMVGAGGGPYCSRFRDGEGLRGVPLNADQSQCTH